MLSLSPLSRALYPGREAGATAGPSLRAGRRAPAAVLSLSHWLARPPLRRAIGRVRHAHIPRPRPLGARASIGPGPALLAPDWRAGRRGRGGGAVRSWQG